MNSRTGGCMCGAVRYELRSEPSDCGWCHCRTCQLSSGAPAMVFASVPVGDFRWTQGEASVKRVQSSSFGYRVFCGDCGTPLYMRVEHEPNEIDFSVATLDQPGIVTPEFHIFWSSKLAWFQPSDRLPRYDRSRPGTGGPEDVGMSGD